MSFRVRIVLSLGRQGGYHRPTVRPLNHKEMILSVHRHGFWLQFLVFHREVAASTDVIRFRQQSDHPFISNILLV